MPSHAEFWTVILLAVVLKLPLALVLWAIWAGARAANRADTGPAVHERRMALCGYCGHRIAVGYDAARMHRQATLISGSTGEAPFDIETRLIREELALPDRFPVEPSRCPGCGETAAWAPIDALDEVTAAAIRPLRPE